MSEAKQKEKKVSDSQTVMSYLMEPKDANVMGRVHGGVIMSLVDKIAYVTASKHAGMPCVTVCVDKIIFHEPIWIGDLVTLKASVNYVGRTSMEIGVRIESENLFTGKKIHSNSCYMIMVAIGNDGKPHEVPRLLLENEHEKKRWEAAERRKLHKG